MTDHALIVQRKGYSRRSAIPAKLLGALNAGEEEPLTLAEWLAIDAAALLRRVLPAIGLHDHVRAIVRVARAAAGDGPMARQRAIGQALFRVTNGRPRGEAVCESLATHRSGMVREWAAMMIAADTRLEIEERIARARRFAQDKSMNVREIAWISYRPFIAADMDRALTTLLGWVRDDDANVRRCAIESTRPRSVWCEHLSALKQRPGLALNLLEVVRADTSRYVQLSVGNWLNDASKTKPQWVSDLCARWIRQSSAAETAFIVNRALRTIRKSGAGGA